MKKKKKEETQEKMKREQKREKDEKRERTKSLVSFQPSVLVFSGSAPMTTELVDSEIKACQSEVGTSHLYYFITRKHPQRIS